MVLVAVVVADLMTRFPDKDDCAPDKDRAPDIDCFDEHRPQDALREGIIPANPDEQTNNTPTFCDSSNPDHQHISADHRHYARRVGQDPDTEWVASTRLTKAPTTPSTAMPCGQASSPTRRDDVSHASRQGTGTAEWTIVVYSPGRWLTANIDRHIYDRARLVSEWRQNTVAACHRAQLPTGIATPIRISAVIVHAGARAPVRDRLNLAPTIKAIVDGLAPQRRFTRRAGLPVVAHGYGFLPDDNDTHVVDTTWTVRRAEPGELRVATGCVYLTLTRAEAAS